MHTYLDILVHYPLRDGLGLLRLRVGQQFVELRETLDAPSSRLRRRLDNPHVLAKIPVQVELRAGSPGRLLNG